MRKTALIAGATGLVGSRLLEQLLRDERYGKVVVFVRRSVGMAHPKLEEHLIDFDQPGQWQELLRGDVLFLALGTTRARAGGKSAQYRVDHGYQYRVAEAASRNGVPVVVLVSSAGASEKSSFFYMRMKGQLEQDIARLPFRRLGIVRPGALTGPRHETRPGEKAGILVLRCLNRLGLLRRMRPVPAEVVARAMRHAAREDAPGVFTWELGEVFDLAGHPD
jgi:uncharacterized protein YbjT (DUF2867 family)